MYTNSINLKLGIIGKPNSGKSTLFNCLLGKKVSPVGDEYGLTKTLFKEKIKFKDYNFLLIDTPGLRRKRKVTELSELSRNREVLRLIDNVDAICLLIDSYENITKQDFKLADLVISKQKIIYFLFNKIDILDEKKKYISKTYKYLEKNYSKHLVINVEFISAKKNIGISKVLEGIIKKMSYLPMNIDKSKLNKFLNHLGKVSTYPKVKKIEIKPKYIVQLKNKIPTFKVFINSKNRAPQIFQKYFDNSFRKYFKLKGIPIVFKFISSKNPYSN